MDWRKLVDLLKNHKVYIQTHNFPDMDALASALGLQVFLKEHEVPTTLCYAGTIEKLSTKRMMEIFDFKLYNITEISNMREEDYIVTVDSQKYNANITDFVGDEEALQDIGSGGGHACMAGGFIPADQEEKLGHMKRYAIEQRFIRVCDRYEDIVAEETIGERIESVHQ